MRFIAKVNLVLSVMPKYTPELSSEVGEDETKSLNLQTPSTKLFKWGEYQEEDHKTQGKQRFLLLMLIIIIIKVNPKSEKHWLPRKVTLKMKLSLTEVAQLVKVWHILSH